jgi:ubiquinone/menaquinone biosynthesis C-methylase UbiE
LYDVIAAFYRVYLIKRSLNYFVSKYFTANTRVLHAGAGSGQVDMDIHTHVRITALDISANALRFYRAVNGAGRPVTEGDIFRLPFKDNSFEGIYNLGVMEHFTAADIQRILAECKRVLKPQGRMIFFWPPEFGLSVIFFKVLGWLFINILRKKDVKFHPDELTRIRSKQHAYEMMQSAGLTVNRYYFGPKDALTYSVVVAQKL